MPHERTHDRSWQTADRGPPEITGRFLSTERLGPRRTVMKNGWLVCHDVPVARVGWMMYGPGEVPVQPSPTQSAIYVERTADELFDPTTVASFEGIGLVNDHPDFNRHPQGLTADNARELAGGHLTNVRRGKDGDEEVLIGDIVVTRRDFIEDVLSGKREISAGYDASYKTVRPGVGQQHHIIANHIALVSRGRCGPRCAIGDHATTHETGATMPKETQGGARRRVTLDDVEYEEIDKSQSLPRRRLTDDDEGIHVHIHGTAQTTDAAPQDKDKDGDERIGKLEKMVESVVSTVTALGESMRSLISGRHATADGMSDAEKAAAALADKATADAAAAAAALQAATQDSAALAGSYQELVSKAEILVPGFKVPTFDAAQKRQLTVDAMCSMRRSVLDQFVATEPGKASVASIVGDVAALKEMDCASVAVVFNAASAAKATSNTAAATRDSQHLPKIPVALGAAVPPVSAVVLNAAHRKFWDNQSRTA